MANEIKIYGVVGRECTAAGVRDQLATMDQTQPLTVRIDSPGGSVPEGFAIFTELEAYQGEKTAVVQSSAFSIASYIAMVCDRVEMARNGYMMIHNPMWETEGDDEQLARDAEYLAKLKASMIEAYANKSGKPSEEIAALMKAETYFDAQEAVEAGLADAVLQRVTASRIEACFLDNVPHKIVASLRKSDVAGGDLPSPLEKKPVSDTPKAVAATVQEIKAAFPKVSSDFILACVEKSLPIAEVATKAAEEMMEENEELKAKIASMEEEMAMLKAKAEELEESKVMEEEELLEAKARAKANSPVSHGNGGPSESATVRWKKAVAEAEARGMNRIRAVQAANRANPGLREQVLAEANAR